MEGRPPESRDTGEILGDIIDILRNGLQMLSTEQDEDRLREVIGVGSGLLEFFEELVSVAGGPIIITRIRNHRNEDFQEATDKFIKAVLEEKSTSAKVESFLASLQISCNQLIKRVSQRKSEDAQIPEEENARMNEGTASPAPQIKVNVTRFFTTSAILSEESYKCKTCPDKPPFSNFKAYQRHVHQKHPDEDKLTAEDLHESNKIKCLLSSKKFPGRLCNRLVKKNDICRHLRDTHGQQRPEKKKIFKGFFSTDNKVSHFPAWGNKNESFAEEEIIEIEVNADGGLAEREAVDDRVEVETDMVEVGVDTNNSATSSGRVDSGSNERDEAPHSVAVEKEYMEDAASVMDEGNDVGSLGLHSISEDVLMTSSFVSHSEDAVESLLNPTKNTVVGLDTSGPQVSFSSPSSKSPENVQNEDSSVDASNSQMPSQNEHDIFKLGAAKEKELAQLISEDSTVDGYDFTLSNNLLEQAAEVSNDVLLTSAAICSEKDFEHTEGVSNSGNSASETLDSMDLAETSDYTFLESSLQPPIEDLQNVLTSSSFPHKDVEDFTTDKSKDVGDLALTSLADDAGEQSDNDLVLVVANEPKDLLASSQEYPALLGGETSQKEEADKNFTELRHQKRNDLEPIVKLSDLEENAEFISEFWEWQVSKNFSNKNAEKVSTLKLSKIHLFTAPDSWLNYFTTENPGFNLNQLLQFDNDNFVAVPSPIKWLTLLGGKSGQEFPNRRGECVKGFKRLLKFLNFRLSEKVFRKNTLLLKRDIKDHLKDISDIIDSMDFHYNLRTMANSQNSQKKEMSDIVNPHDEESEYLAVSTWFGSEESKTIEKEGQDIWKKSKASGKPTKKDFTRYSNISYLELALTDKLRTGVYNVVTNRDFVMKKAVYLPVGFSDPNYDKLPANWKIYQKPKLDPKATPSRYEIRIPGDRPGMKNKQPQTITLNSRTHEILSRYQDLKRMVFGQDLDLNSPFFVNFEGGEMAELRNYKGSLLNLVGKVTNVQKFTLKTTRKGVDAKIQNDESLKNHIKDLNSHSLEVGRDHYDNMNFARRTVLSNSLNKVEGSDLKRSLEVCEETAKKRAKIEETEQEQLRIDAQQYLDDEKKKKPKDLSPDALTESALILLRKLFKDKTSGPPNAWQKRFYALVDSPTSGDLRDIEEILFRKYKAVIEKKNGWTGSIAQNKSADKSVSAAAKTLVDMKEE